MSDVTVTLSQRLLDNLLSTYLRDPDVMPEAMRELYKALRNAKPVGETWEPLKNYKHEALNGYTVEVETGNGLQIMNWDLSGAYYAVVDLPDNVRLCRKGG